MPPAPPVPTSMLGGQSLESPALEELMLSTSDVQCILLTRR